MINRFRVRKYEIHRPDWHDQHGVGLYYYTHGTR